MSYYLFHLLETDAEKVHNGNLSTRKKEDAVVYPSPTPPTPANGAHDRPLPQFYRPPTKDERGSIKTEQRPKRKKKKAHVLIMQSFFFVEYASMYTSV